MTRILLGLAAICFAQTSSVLAQTGPDDMGIGMAMPLLVDERPVYFYGAVDPNSHPSQHAPADSVVFESGVHHIEINYAPAWLDTDIVSLNNDQLFFRVVSESQNWVEVIVNGSDPLPRTFSRTMWMNREAVQLVPWPEFFLDVHSVEPINATTNPLRSGPGDETADLGSSEGQIYRVVSVRSNWMLVESTDFRESGTPRGWIRWNDGVRLLVRFNLLS